MVWRIQSPDSTGSVAILNDGRLLDFDNLDLSGSENFVYWFFFTTRRFLCTNTRSFEEFENFSEMHESSLNSNCFPRTRTITIPIQPDASRSSTTMLFYSSSHCSIHSAPPSSWSVGRMRARQDPKMRRFKYPTIRQWCIFALSRCNKTYLCFTISLFWDEPN